MSSNTSVANRRPTIQSLAFSSFGSHLYSYPLEPLCTLVHSFSVRSHRTRLIVRQELRYTGSHGGVPIQGLSIPPAYRSTSIGASWRCQ